MKRGVWLFVLAALWVGCGGDDDGAVDGGDGRVDGGTIDGSTPGDDGSVPGDGSMPTDGAVLDDGSVADGSVPPRDGGGETCTDACAFGAERCAGAQIQECVIDPATRCTVWGTATDCGGGLVCSGDECTASCSDVCTVGAQRCASDASTQTCAMQASGCTDWSPEASCPGEQVCADDACMACTDGARRCGVASIEECADGSWVAVESCAFGCRDAACTTAVTCTAGAYRCNGDAVETCNSSGTAWLYLSSCGVGCSMGLCTGACTPGETRCNGSGVETCNAGGTAWTATESCASTFCSRGACALDGLDIGASRSLEGEIVVDGPVIVRSGATVTATGPLTIRADSIVIEDGGSISAVPYGTSPSGRGRDGAYQGSGCYCNSGGSGGGYGTTGTSSRVVSGGSVWGSTNDSDVQPGSRGGNGYSSSPGQGGRGGGVIRLIADAITIAGQVTADGEAGQGTGGGVTYAGGGGSGGGILLAADQLRISGSVAARGGAGGSGSSTSLGGAGGNGRIKILYGALREETGTVSGTVTRSLMPPLEIGSSTHPDPNLYYNDGFDLVALSWTRPYAPLTGYYWLTHTAERVPTPANASFVASELVAVPRSSLSATANFFQIVSVNPTATVGTALSPFRIRVNATPPTVTSSSHPSQTAWSTNPNVFFSWNAPNGAANYRGIYYVFDHYGDTIPGPGSTFVPISQLQVLLSGVAEGVWGFHAISIDTQGRRTQTANHYRVRIGTDPGAGNVLGQIVGPGGAPITGARVSVNRELFPGQSTTATGNYNIASIPVGTWELHVSAPGYRSEVRSFSVASAGASTSVNVTLMPE